MIEKILALFNTDTGAVVAKFYEILPNLGAALAVLVLFWIWYVATRGILRRGLVRADFNETLIRILIQNIYLGVLVVIAGIMALGHLGVNVVAATAGFGIAGIAVGFAAQDVLSNFIAGFMIFWDKPFRIGQWVTVAGEYGKVDDITLRTTRIKTRNNTYVVIPNQKVINEVLINHSRKGMTRVNARVGIAYKENIDHARAVLIEEVLKLDKILHTPSPEVVVESLGDSSVNLVVQVWVENAEDEITVLFTATEQCKKALDAAHIQIPFPHRQIFMEENHKTESSML